jgi:hypothetical protein
MASEATAPQRMQHDIFNEITKSMSEKRSLGGLFCDLEKAFDCVNHKILLEKLEFYGITGKLLDLIQSFLEGGYQKVLINTTSVGASSGWKTIKHGSTGLNPRPPVISYLYK